MSWSPSASTKDSIYLVLYFHVLPGSFHLLLRIHVCFLHGSIRNFYRLPRKTKSCAYHRPSILYSDLCAVCCMLTWRRALCERPLTRSRSRRQRWPILRPARSGFQTPSSDSTITFLPQKVPGRTGDRSRKIRPVQNNRTPIVTPLGLDLS